MFMLFHILKILHQEFFLYSLFLFSPSNLQRNTDDNHDPRGEVSFVNFLFVSSWFVNC
jgi:hypothetical protein